MHNLKFQRGRSPQLNSISHKGTKDTKKEKSLIFSVPPWFLLISAEQRPLKNPSCLCALRVRNNLFFIALVDP
jgi:hypothetical protein